MIKTVLDYKVNIAIGVHTTPSMCDAGIQCDLLCPPLTSTPIKGRVAPVVEDAYPLELTEKE